MTRLEAQFPIAGRECRFYLIDNSTFIGFFDHGGAYDYSSIRSTDGKDFHFKQNPTKPNEDYNNIVGWEYYTKKT